MALPKRKTPTDPSRYEYGDELKERLGQLSGLGMEFIVAILVVGGAGYAIDRWVTHTAPWGMVIGGAIGLVVGCYKFVRDANAANRASVREASERRERRP
jgi:F0F1-type ATP synthase assembly protein I